jgi:hypothetical protein
VQIVENNVWTSSVAGGHPTRRRPIYRVVVPVATTAAARPAFPRAFGDGATAAVSAQSVSPPSSRRRRQLFPLSVAAGIAGRLAAACVAAAAASYDRLNAAVALCSVAECIAERFSASYW